MLIGFLSRMIAFETDKTGGDAGGTGGNSTNHGNTGGTGAQQPQGGGAKQRSGDDDDDDDLPAASRRELERDNYRLREQRRTYRNQVTDLEAKLQQLQGQLPGQGAVVLTPEQAALWQAYQRLGAPTDISAIVTERDQLKTTADERAFADLVTEAAGATGFKPTVLVDRVKASGVTVVLKEETVQGRQVKVPYVQHKDAAGKDAETALAKFAEAQWADYLPALRAATRAQNTSNVGTPQRGQGQRPAAQVKQAQQDNPSAQKRVARF